MPIEYIDFEEARDASGLRMVVVTGVPSPWGEAAKGIFHVKSIPWKAVALDQSNAAMAEWTGERGGPVAIYEDEAPRADWAQILLLAERLAPARPLIPVAPLERAEFFGLAHEICGEDGLGWARRLQGIDSGINGRPGFPLPIAKYLAGKYGYRVGETDRITARVVELLDMLCERLRRQKDRGSRFYLGDDLTALDIYSATFMALFTPLPAESCPLPDAMRPAFETMNESTANALDPCLLEHRDFVYQNYLELPLSI